MTIIDKTDLTALRKADSVCFDHNVKTGNGDERGSFIRAIKDKGYDNPDPFAQDVTHRIAVDSHAFSYAGARPTEMTAFEMISSAQIKETWRTIVALLRAGDDIRLAWAADNDNGYMESANLHRDELDLIVVRGKNKYTFRVAVSVCADNSARMVRQLGYSLR